MTTPPFSMTAAEALAPPADGLMSAGQDVVI